MVKILMGGGKIQKLHQRAVQRRVLSRRTCRILRFRNLSGSGPGVTGTTTGLPKNSDVAHPLYPILPG